MAVVSTTVPANCTAVYPLGIDKADSGLEPAFVTFTDGKLYQVATVITNR